MYKTRPHISRDSCIIIKITITIAKNGNCMAYLIYSIIYKIYILFINTRTHIIGIGKQKKLKKLTIYQYQQTIIFINIEKRYCIALDIYENNK